MCAAFIGLVFCFSAAANGADDWQFRLFNPATEGTARTMQIVFGDAAFTNGEKSPFERLGKNGREFQKKIGHQSDFIGVNQDQAAEPLATLTVTNLNDSGAGSLREAINAANANSDADTIVFASGLQGTIALSSALPTVIYSVSIVGPGARLLTVRRQSGFGSFRIFDVSGAAVISNLTIAGGNSGGFGGDDGGGLRVNFAGYLELNDCAVINNTANGNGGGIANLGGTLRLSRVTISGNSAPNGSGGGIYSTDGTTQDGDAVVNSSTVSGNTARYGAGIANVYVSTQYAFGARAIIYTDNTTIAFNTATAATPINGSTTIGGGAHQANDRALWFIRNTDHLEQRARQFQQRRLLLRFVCRAQQRLHRH